MRKYNIETGNNAITVEGFVKEQNESITALMKQLVETYESRAEKNEKRVTKAPKKVETSVLTSIAGATATKNTTVEEIESEGGRITDHFTIGEEACVGYAYAIATSWKKEWEPSKKDSKLENLFQTITFKLDDESEFVWKKFISQRPIGAKTFGISKKNITGDDGIDGTFGEDIVGKEKFIVFETSVVQKTLGCFDFVYYTNTDILQMYDAETVIAIEKNL